MKHAQLIDRLHVLAEGAAPGPDPAFVARLGAELRHMDQVPVLSEPRPAHRPRLGHLSWVRIVSLVVPAGAIALAGAFVALRPEPPRPNQVRTADPGVTAPAPDAVETDPAQPATPATTDGSVTRPPITAGPPAANAPAATTHTARPPTAAPPIRHLVVPAPAEPSPQPTTAPGTRPEPTTTTTTAPPPAPPQTLSLHCTSGMPGGAPAVSCTWSASTASAFHSYRLSREKPGTSRVVVFTSDNRDTTSYVDHDVQAGSGYSYWIEVLDASGTVIAHSSAATVSCC